MGVKRLRAHRLESSALGALALLPRRRRRALHHIDEVSADTSPPHRSKLQAPRAPRHTTIIVGELDPQPLPPAPPPPLLLPLLVDGAGFEHGITQLWAAQR